MISYYLHQNHINRMNYWPTQFFTSFLGSFWFGSLTVLYGLMVLVYNMELVYFDTIISKSTVRYWMIRWNIFISSISGVGFLLVWRNFPGIVHVFNSECATCEIAWVHGNRIDTYAVFIFMFLKPVEFLDTVFLILNGKPISKLHWVHHITVTLFCWHSAIYVNNAAGSMFALMNYFVHAIMYGYYAIRSMGINPADYGLGNTVIPLTITVLQILQMIAGLLMMVQVALKCSWDVCNPINTLFGLGIYGTYFHMFVEYFFKRYLY